MKSTWIVAVIVAAFAALLAIVALTGLFSVERQRGFLAPVWDRAGEKIYFLERRTFGLVWGLGWEFFSPPASSYALHDSFSLRRLDPATGAIETLLQLPSNPIVNRVTKRYRGRIFGYPAARLHPGAENGIDFHIRLSVPKSPSSEIFQLKGSWQSDKEVNVAWRTGGVSPSASEFVLVNGREVVVLDGPEGYGAAIVVIEEDGRHRVLLQSDAFSDRYPNGVSAKVLAAKSRRGSIERVRQLRRVRAELVAKYRRRGLNEMAAAQKAGEDMEELGYYPKGPRMVATPLDAAPEGLPVFEISAMEFKVGLFSDIAAALAEPGTEVRPNMGAYIRHRDFDTSERINTWRKAGNDRMVLRHRGRLFLIEYRRFDR
jgi:hypothetical protein